jgi:hypothetical protein
MALRHVRDFVGDDAGQFVFVLRRQQQPGMNTDKSARSCKGIDSG